VYIHLHENETSNRQYQTYVILEVTKLLCSNNRIRYNRKTQCCLH